MKFRKENVLFFSSLGKKILKYFPGHQVAKRKFFRPLKFVQKDKMFPLKVHGWNLHLKVGRSNITVKVNSSSEPDPVSRAVSFYNHPRGTKRRRTSTPQLRPETKELKRSLECYVYGK